MSQLALSFPQPLQTYSSGNVTMSNQTFVPNTGEAVHAKQGELGHLCAAHANNTLRKLSKKTTENKTNGAFSDRILEF